MTEQSLEIWDLWYPKAGPTGISFARCRIDPTEMTLVHALPPHVTVQVRDGQGRLLAEGKDLPATMDSPMARLTRVGNQVQREDLWPGPDDQDALVLLPGGEAGRLKGWWNADDHSEWRWQVEFYNQREFTQPPG